MDSAKAKIISDLIGSVSVSELNYSPVSPVDNNSAYVVYKNESEDEVKKITSETLHQYLLKRVFLFLVGDNYDFGGLTAILSELTDKTPIGLGRYLHGNDKYKDWVGTSTKPISDSFLENFQYHYFNNLSDSPRTMLLRYVSTSALLTLAPTMWDTHLTEEYLTKGDITIKPVNGKNLSIPDSSKSAGKFVQRNYAKIAGYPDKGMNESVDADKHWGSNNGSIETDSLGDIDRTIESVTEYAADFLKNLQAVTPTYNGMVILTTSRVYTPDESSSGWKSSDFDGKFIMSTIGASLTEGGEDTVKVSQVPTHGHGDTSQNVSILGRPVSENHGGIAVASSIEKNTKSQSGKAIMGDTTQTIEDCNRFLSSMNGPYTGGVRYSDLKNNTTTDKQVGHNNIPLHENVRVWVKHALQPAPEGGSTNE